MQEGPVSDPLKVCPRPKELSEWRGHWREDLHGGFVIFLEICLYLMLAYEKSVCA